MAIVISKSASGLALAWSQLFAGPCNGETQVQAAKLWEASVAFGLRSLTIDVLHHTFALSWCSPPGAPEQTLLMPSHHLRQTPVHQVWGWMHFFQTTALDAGPCVWRFSQTNASLRLDALPLEPPVQFDTGAVVARRPRGP